MEIFRKHATVLTLAGVAAIITGTFLAIYSQYIFSSFLYFDDTVFLPQAVFDVDRLFRTKFIIIDLFAKLDSFAALKLMSSLFQPAIAIVVVLLLKRTRVALPFAAALALLIVSYPLATDQPFFVTGSHSAMGLFWALCALYAFLSAYEEDNRRFYPLMIASFALLVVAAISSPSMMIATLSPIFWILTALLFKRANGARVIIVIATTAIFSIILLTYQYSHHEYVAMKGWLSYSPADMIGKLGVAIGMIFAELLRAPVLVSVAYFGGIAAFAAIAFRSSYSGGGGPGSGFISTDQDDRTRVIIFSIACLVMAALTFVPASIIVNFRDRYIVPAFMLTALAILAPVAAAVSRSSQRLRRMAFALLLVLTGMNIELRRHDVAERFSPYLRTHDKIAELVAGDEKSWPERAQIVILLAGDAPFVTGGFKSQSTWYLRSLSRRTDILALIGPARFAKGSPFDSKASFRGERYWRVRNGRAERVKMYGLELDRPLFVYKLNATTPPHLTPVIFNTKYGQAFVAPGGIPSAAMKPVNSPPDCEIPSDKAFIWDGKGGLRGAKRRVQPSATNC